MHLTELLQVLARIGQQAPVLLVASRMASIQQSDGRVLDEGRIAACGSHQQLLHESVCHRELLCAG